MKPKYPFIATLLFVVLTIGLFPPTVLSRDRGNGHEQQAESTRNGDVPWGDLSGDEQATLKDHRRNWTDIHRRNRKNCARAPAATSISPPGNATPSNASSSSTKMSPREREQLREKYREQRD